MGELDIVTTAWPWGSGGLRCKMLWAELSAAGLGLRKAVWYLWPRTQKAETVWEWEWSRQMPMSGSPGGVRLRAEVSRQWSNLEVQKGVDHWWGICPQWPEPCQGSTTQNWTHAWGEGHGEVRLYLRATKVSDKGPILKEEGMFSGP